MTGLSLIHQEIFTSDGATKRLSLPGGADYIRVFNQTQAAANGTASVNDAFQWEWYSNYAQGTSFVSYKESGGNTVLMDENTANKLIYRDGAPAPEAAKTGTTIVRATGVCTTSAAHGYAVGDKVRIYNNTVMTQIAGVIYEITAVPSTTTFTIGYANISGMAADETAFSVRRMPPEVQVLPGAEFITNITAASSAVVTFSVAHNYKVGDVIYFRVPASFGMVEMDGLSGKVTAVAASTVTVDIDSSNFTAFAWPAAASVPIKFAVAGLAGKRGLYDDWFSSSRSLLDLDPFRHGLDIPYLLLAGGAGNAGGDTNDVVVVQAYRAM